MPKDLLLEIGLEEMPARFVRAAMEQLQDKTEKWLADSRLSYGKIKAYATPRRLAVSVKDVADKQSDLYEEVKGPARHIALDASGELSKAALGFARNQGVPQDALFFRERDGVAYLYARKIGEGEVTGRLLPEGLSSLITSLTFPKQMRWGGHDLRYIRPIRWLVALHGADIVDLEIAGVASGRATCGHRFLGQYAEVEEASQYADVLRAQHVIADVEERRHRLVSGLESLAAERGWHIDIREDLLEEVLFLIETPTVLAGSFDPAFLRIPQKALITSMREHQRYFPVLDQAGKLQPYFVTVRNGGGESLDIVAKGNEKVLRARLSDAKFFYEEDQKLSIADALKKLEAIVYHEELGSMADKVRRIRMIADRLAAHLLLDETVRKDVSRAAEICKFDLVTQMVYEFPELQGVMGEAYARLVGETDAVARAVHEHYAPRSAADQPPASIIGAVVGIADKIDTIVGCFSIGIVPTGSQDPYALRRQAAGIVGTLLAHELELTLPELFRIALDAHASREHKREAADVVREMQEFFALRVKNVLAERGIRYDIIDAVLGAVTDDVRRTVLRAEALAVAATEEGKERFRPALDCFHRVCGLAAKAEGRHVDAGLFARPPESDLYDTWQAVHDRYDKAIADARMDEALAALTSLCEPVNAFFSSVMVMSEDEAVRRNRLALLANIADDVKSFVDFSKLVG
ncbi:Glycine--tRNA ligase beta subunit [Paenibacillus solanacearum]|uniref:Glycine--tRNA ligase beta subunit n=1 Tax=Paenibacillus solanacearum TaxID=2048548 RepID=A0A916JZX6_9BACL|nr:glycine--tRNA ligase subunit beta [Paenibacillus solanacearum]CAG7619741.1 Glycine--tRNA ligase beta subunit [Paenibacillus solanacearum]